MKKHCPLIKLVIHPSTLLYFMLSIFVGWFKESLLAFFIILFHEYAHTITAWLLSYDIEKIHLYPFGAFVEINDYGLHENWQDFSVAISGPLSYFLLLGIGFLAKDFLGPHSYYYFQNINRAVLLFNLLPIWPLDGAKILLIGLSYIVDYLQALKTLIPVSVLSLVLLMKYAWGPNYYLVYGYLCSQIVVFGRHFYFHYLRLLFSRSSRHMHGPVRFHGDRSFFKPYTNYYYYKGRILDEKEFINSKIFIDNG